MQIRKKEASNKVFLYSRHPVTPDVLQIADRKLDLEPPAAHIGPEAEALRQAKLKMHVRPGRSQEPEITIVKSKIPARISTA